MGTLITGKQVAVVGASRGIGLEYARQFLQKDNTVYATSRTPSPGLEKLRKEHDARLSVSTLDTNEPSSIQAWARELKGVTKGLDVVIVNAGVYGSSGSLSSVEQEDMLQTFRTNAVGPLLVAQQLVKASLLKRGSILANMTSKMGSMGDNGSGSSYGYRASKAALNAVTKSLSVDLEGQGITVLVLHPGWVKTDMTGQQGLIDVTKSVSGLIGVLESNLPLAGHFWDWKQEEVPW